MAKKKARMGAFYKVPNTKRLKFSNASMEYWAARVQDPDGGNERTILLTDKEMARIEHRSNRNKEDWLQPDFWTDILD